MTLSDISEKTMKLMEEYISGGKWDTQDSDYSNKFIAAVNDVGTEISRLCAIRKTATAPTGWSVLPRDVRDVICVKKDGKIFYDYKVEDNNIWVKGDEEVTVEYDARWTLYTDDTPIDTVLPFPDEVASIMPYGIVKLILLGSGDYSTSTEFEQKYYTLLQEVPKTAGRIKVKVVSLYG